MQALDARNKISHVYDAKKFEDIIAHDHYLQIFDDLYISLLEESLQSGDIFRFKITGEI